MYVVGVYHVELVSWLEITLHIGEADFHSANLPKSEEWSRKKTIRVRVLSFLFFDPDGNCLSHRESSEISLCEGGDVLVV